MSLPSADTPLYNHALPDIEQWLTDRGCQQSKDDIHCWNVQYPDWKAEICLDVDQLTVRYYGFDGSDRSIQRAFKYSLTRKDIEEAIYAGP
jgi:hypothetical protein